MEDAFGDPGIVSDVRDSLSVATVPLPLESDTQSGIPVSDYLDTDYNVLDIEHQETYESSPSLPETNSSDQEQSLGSSNEIYNAVAQSNSSSLLTPINLVFNFAAAQFSALKNAVSSRLDSNEPQLEEVNPESDASSPKKIVTSLLVTPQPPSSDKTFTTQDEILDEVGASADENGICSPVVNLYFEKKLGLRDDSFMTGSAEHIYKEAIKEKLHQIDLIHQGKDGLHAVFVDHNIPYKTKQVKASESESEGTVEALLQDYDQALITYPTVSKDGERDRHQIYVEKIGNQCSRFDVNKKGGVEEMPCTLFYQKLAKKIAKTHDENEDEEVIIAGIKK